MYLNLIVVTGEASTGWEASFYNSLCSGFDLYTVMVYVLVSKLHKGIIILLLMFISISIAVEIKA